MRQDDIQILQEIQHNAKTAMKAIDAVSEKIYDDDLAMQATRESMKYSELYNKATDRLLEGRAPSYRETAFQDMMVKNAVRGNMLFNTSTSHIAAMMIQGSNRGLTNMWRAMNHHENAGKFSVEIAKELMDFEKKNIEQLRQYL